MARLLIRRRPGRREARGTQATKVCVPFPVNPQQVAAASPACAHGAHNQSYASESIACIWSVRVIDSSVGVSTIGL